MVTELDQDVLDITSDFAARSTFEVTEGGTTAIALETAFPAAFGQELCDIGQDWGARLAASAQELSLQQSAEAGVTAAAPITPGA